MFDLKLQSNNDFLLIEVPIKESYVSYKYEIYGNLKFYSAGVLELSGNRNPYITFNSEDVQDNIFFVKDGVVHTPTPDAFLNGITRQTVIDLLKEKGISVIERHIMPEELEGFEQCWLTGTAAEVTPVGQIGDYTFEVGALTKEISNSYDNLVRS